MKKLGYFLRVVAVLMMVAGVVFTWLEYKRTSQLNALVEMGYPVTPEAMLKYYAPVPDEENAWTLLKGLQDQIPYSEGVYAKLPIVGEAEWCKDSEPMPPDMREATEEFLRMNSNVLETIHKAAQNPYLRFPGKVTKEGYLDVMVGFEECMQLHNLWDYIELEGFHALEKGDINQAVKDLDTILKLARLEIQTPDPMRIYSQSFAIASGLDLLPKFLHMRHRDDVLISSVQDMLKRENSVDGIRHFFAMELAFGSLRDVLEDRYIVFDFGGLGDQLILIDEHLEQLVPILKAIYTHCFQRYTGISTRYDFLKALAHTHPQTHAEFEATYTATHDTGNEVNLDFVTSDSYYDLIFIDCQFRDICKLHFWEVACALKRYNIRHGQYPAELSSLVPELFETLPLPTVKGTDWEYTIDGENCTLRYPLNDYYYGENLEIGFAVSGSSQSLS